LGCYASIKDVFLSERIIHFFQDVFNADLSIDEIKVCLGEDNSTMDILFDCFSGCNNAHHSSVQRRMIGNAKYIRRRVDKFLDYVQKEELNAAHCSLFNDSVDSDTIMRGSSKYYLNPNATMSRS
jgi:hypothetical protein